MQAIRVGTEVGHETFTKKIIDQVLRQFDQAAALTNLRIYSLQTRQYQRMMCNPPCSVFPTATRRWVGQDPRGICEPSPCFQLVEDGCRTRAFHVGKGSFRPGQEGVDAPGFFRAEIAPVCL